MSIAIIGAGNVGMAIAGNLFKKDEYVFFGVPDPAQYLEKAKNINAKVGSVSEAIAAGDIIILAVPYIAALEIASSNKDWNGKILVDATNPLLPDFSGLQLGTTTSAAEEIAKRANNAHVVKAFNTTGAENQANPEYPGGTPFLPVCGDDADARQKVLSLATRMGFEAVDFGPLSAARFQEPLAMAFIHMAFHQGYGRNFAFGLLKR